MTHSDAHHGETGPLTERERSACPDPYCRICKDQDGEVRDGYALSHPAGKIPVHQDRQAERRGV